MTVKVCAQCDTAFQPGESIVNALSKTWHQSCFVCGECHKPFTDSFILDSKGDPIHESCHRSTQVDDLDDDGDLDDSKSAKQIRTNCPVCQKSLAGTEPILSLSSREKYHQKCFVCYKCQKPFQGVAFFKEHGKPCHAECVSSEKKLAQSALKALDSDQFCQGCGQAFESFGSRRYVEDVGHYHPNCFVCGECKVVLDGLYYIHPEKNEPCCQNCAKFF